MSRGARRVKPASVASVSALLAVLLLGVAYLCFGVLQVDPLAERITARMALHDSGNLNVGAPILLTGIRVGKVTAVDKRPGGAEITLSIDEGQRIPVFSAIRIENLSALGEPYIEFAPHDDRGPYIRDNQFFDAGSVSAPVLIPELSVRAVEFIDQLNPATISSLAVTMDRALTGTEAQMPALERASRLLAATLLSRTGTIRQLLADLQTTGADMEWAPAALAVSGPMWSALADRLSALIQGAAAIFEVGDSPTQYLTGDGVVPFLVHLNALLTKIGPELAELAPIVRPMVADMTPQLARLDIGALISQAVGTVGNDGTIHLRINIK